MAEVKVALFLDGPLAGETMEMVSCPPTWMVALPKRITWCDCDDESGEPFEYPPENKAYYVVSRGEHHCLYSEYDDDSQAIINSLKAWRRSDFSMPAWTTNCRSRRAFR